ncbi:hypothetical protein ABZX40_36480 [Streptomyces sp. NPDC004610]|uniref:hypothetical protein n=1 Tax=unclassified Streptomyces TaxID=2593676 RepID=UPI0033B444DE
MPTPTPRDMAAAPRRAPAQAPAPAPVPAGYDRHRWEQALIATPLPHSSARLLAWGLAHLAGDSGRLAAGTTDARRLADRLGVPHKHLGLNLWQLERAGLIHRPAENTWQPRHMGRPVTLTIPPAPQPDAV